MRYLLCLAFFALLACGPTNTNITDSWKNKQALKERQVNSIFLAALSPNIEYKTMLEDELAYMVKQKGVKPVKSYEVFQGITKDNMPSREEILDKIRKTKADVILTISLRKLGTSTAQDGAVELTAPQTISFYGYYSSNFPMIYDPVVNGPDRIYYLESNLFDATTEELLWSAKSETYNPSGEESFVKGYTETLINKLEKDGILKKG